MGMSCQSPKFHSSNRGTVLHSPKITPFFEFQTIASYYRLHANSVTKSRSLTQNNLPHPSPSLPHDSDHAECGGVLCLHGSTPFQYFRAGAI